jgi:diaminopimelate epimerase
MGNPHCVLFVEAITDELVTGLGPCLEHHVAFPERANVEFVRVVSANEIEMRVWERGSGETRACGSGACAAVVAGVLCERLERSVAVHLPGGDLDVEWDASGSVFLAGPAVEVFAGEWP